MTRLPPIPFLGDEDVKKIHAAALHLLSHTGLHLPHAEANNGHRSPPCQDSCRVRGLPTRSPVQESERTADVAPRGARTAGGAAD